MRILLTFQFFLLFFFSSLFSYYALLFSRSRSFTHFLSLFRSLFLLPAFGFSFGFFPQRISSPFFFSILIKQHQIKSKEKYDKILCIYNFLLLSYFLLLFIYFIFFSFQFSIKLGLLTNTFN